jgi:DNA-binding HxlR family transcriptional regulator
MAATQSVEGARSIPDELITPTGRLAGRATAAAEGWCPIERALERVGTRSAMILLREVFYGGRRFDDLARSTGLSDAVAAKRLKQLVQDGLLAQQPYREPGARTRYEYVLTDRSRELFALLVALADWGQQFDSGHSSGPGPDHESGAGPGADHGSVEFVHAGCGARLSVAVRCEAGHDVAPGQAEARVTGDPAESQPRSDRSSTKR